MNSIDFKHTDDGWLHVIRSSKMHSGRAYVYKEKEKAVPGTLGRTYTQRFIAPSKDIDRPTKVWTVTSSYYREETGQNYTHSTVFRSREHAKSWFDAVTSPRLKQAEQYAAAIGQ